MERLDDIDIQILKELQRNAKLTVKELADKVHLSASPTFERQKRLEREGYIENYVAVVNPKRVGNTIIALCNLNKLGKIDSIGSLHSIFVIGEVKNAHKVPISTEED